MHQGGPGVCRAERAGAGPTLGASRPRPPPRPCRPRFRSPHERKEHGGTETRARVLRSPYHPGRPPSRVLPGTGGSCWGWGFSPPTSGSAWKDSREVMAAGTCACSTVEGSRARGRARSRAPGLEGVAVKFLGPPGALGAPHPRRSPLTCTHTCHRSAGPAARQG